MPDARAPDGVPTVKRHGQVARRAPGMAPCSDFSQYMVRLDRTDEPARRTG